MTCVDAILSFEVFNKFCMKLWKVKIIYIIYYLNSSHIKKQIIQRMK